MQFRVPKADPTWPDVQEARIAYGRRLAAARLAQHLSQSKLGAQVGITVVRLSKLECGLAAATEAEQRALAEVLGMPDPPLPSNPTSDGAPLTVRERILVRAITSAVVRKLRETTGEQASGGE